MILPVLAHPVLAVSSSRQRSLTICTVTWTYEGDILKTISLPGDRKAVVDDDFPYLDRRFHIDSLGYPRAYIDGKRTRLHTIIMGVRKGYDVDHINRNKLDNQSSNLRHVTHAENLRNRRGWGREGARN